MDQIGFIGLGNMGGPIARRMLAHGASLLVFDKDGTAVAQTVSAGARAAGSVREIADRCEIVFTSLPSPAISHDVALGPEGFAGDGKVEIHVELSTSGAEAVAALSKSLAARGIALIDSPVMGGKVGLDAGTMAVLASGPEEAFERVRPALDRFAGKVFYLGADPGLGQAAKVMNNSMCVASILIACEAVAMGVKAGLDLETAVDIVNQGSGANYITQRVFPQTVVKGEFGPTGAMYLGLKDLQLFVAEARRLDMATPVADAMSIVQEAVLAAGPPDQDALDAFRYFARLADLPARYEKNG